MTDSTRKISLDTTTAKSVSVLNDVTNVSDVQAMLGRVIAKLPCIGSIFTLDQLKALEVKFNVTTQQIAGVVGMCEAVLKQLGYLALKPETFESTLMDVGFNTTIVDAFKLTWSNQGKEYVERLRNMPIAGIYLDDIDYRLNVESSNSGSGRVMQPSVDLSFKLKDATSHAGTGMEPVTVNLDQKQLYSMYEQLEAIQSQLDSMS